MDEQKRAREEREITRMSEDLTNEALQRKLDQAFRKVSDPQRTINRLIKIAIARAR